MRVLIIKMSSMGDIIHALPAITDAGKAIPNIQFDWVAEEGFAEIPLWHQHVNQVIPIALRRWRKNFWSVLKHGEIKKFYQRLRSQKYDLVIDAQASLKSAFISCFSRGKRCGMDSQSERELFANLAYNQTFFVERKQHAIKRLRQLFAQTLNYTFVDDMPNYAIDKNKLIVPTLALPDRYVVLVHNTSWPSKLWPENYWAELLKKITATGTSVLLPWGDAEEKARAERLAHQNRLAQVLPKLKLAEIATVLSNATAAVCADTGLSHLSAALNVPAITLYGPTNPDLIGTVGLSQIHLQPDFPCAPCRQENCSYSKPSAEKPACFTTVTPEKVWMELTKILS